MNLIGVSTRNEVYHNTIKRNHMCQGIVDRHMGAFPLGSATKMLMSSRIYWCTIASMNGNHGYTLHSLHIIITIWDSSTKHEAHGAPMNSLKIPLPTSLEKGGIKVDTDFMFSFPIS